jgi:hypothetical protein
LGYVAAGGVVSLIFLGGLAIASIIEIAAIVGGGIQALLAGKGIVVGVAAIADAQRANRRRADDERVDVAVAVAIPVTDLIDRPIGIVVDVVADLGNALAGVGKGIATRPAR